MCQNECTGGERHANGWTNESRGEKQRIEVAHCKFDDSENTKTYKCMCECVCEWVAVVSLFAIAFICYALFEGLRCYCCWEHKKSDVPHGNRSFQQKKKKKYADNTRDSNDSPFIFVIVNIELISNEFVFLLQMPCQMNHLQPASPANQIYTVKYSTVQYNTIHV